MKIKFHWKRSLRKIIPALIIMVVVMPCHGVSSDHLRSSSDANRNMSQQKTQYVVFKFDDLSETNWKTWKIITDIIIKKDVTAEIGLFVRSLTLGDADYLAYVQSLVDDPKHFEIWLHGWTGEPKEFFETDYDTQLDHFHKARTTMLMKYDYILRSYGDHYWGGNQNTVRVVNEDPFIKGWIHYNPRREKVAGLKPEKHLMYRRVNMEPATAVVSYKKYLSDWSRFNADTLDYVSLQGHPWGYRTDSLQTEFTKIVDDLIAKGVTFTHYSVYNRIIKGYSTDNTPPSVPQGLKASRTDDNHVSLKWEASSDDQSGVDCYKIYRDGICIDLSAVPSFSDSVKGSHTYQVAAVNNNDLVSAKSSAIKL